VTIRNLLQSGSNLSLYAIGCGEKPLRRLSRERRQIVVARLRLRLLCLFLCRLRGSDKDCIFPNQSKQCIHLMGQVLQATVGMLVIGVRPQRNLDLGYFVEYGPCLRVNGMLEVPGLIILRPA
jgi:hypothetical protein